ncbi:CatB-related O-acetyltransferase [Microbulbifer sp. SAOS-129_SWC]|uniref:CatB-related O-acetyltransferase n=1 Tax=Microbulbifer sp. SAOS-129_SWC TaxID=3145235 RepID=UPI003216F5D2
MKYRIPVSNELLAYFNQNRVYFTPFGTCKMQGRFRPNEQLAFPADGVIEPYCNYINGSILFSMGSFSFSRSPLPLDTKVGRYCSIGARVSVLGIDHPITRFTTSSITYDKQAITSLKFFEDNPDLSNFQVRNTEPKNQLGVTIGNDVWIGEDVSIARGVTIGNGAILAAKALITKDVPPYSIVGGVPAKVIRYRFSNEIVEQLCQLQWWDYKVKTILSDNADVDIQEFIIKAVRSIESGKAEPYRPNVVDIKNLKPFLAHA